jgi:hypothetical protein
MNQMLIDLALALAVFLGAVAIMSIPSKKGKK